jgi:hypothetical protein
VPRLSFGEVLSESFGFFFGNIRLFFHLVTVPWIISLLLLVVGAMIGAKSLVFVLVQKAIDILPTLMFMVGWMRVVLLGVHRLDRPPGLAWTPRESAFLRHLIQVAGVTFALIATFVLTIGSIDPAVLGTAKVDPEVAQRQAFAAPLAVGFFVSALLALRVSFGLAATAVDVPFSPRQSWAYSRGHAWAIIGVLFLIYFTGAIATLIATLVPLGLLRGLGAEAAASFVAWVVAVLVSYATVGIAATAQAIIFRRLTRWREGVPLVPPESLT